MPRAISQLVVYSYLAKFFKKPKMLLICLKFKKGAISTQNLVQIYQKSAFWKELF